MHLIANSHIPIEVLMNAPYNCPVTRARTGHYGTYDVTQDGQNYIGQSVSLVQGPEGQFQLTGLTGPSSVLSTVFAAGLCGVPGASN
jgi:hypothetical protein